MIPCARSMRLVAASVIGLGAVIASGADLPRADVRAGEEELLVGASRLGNDESSILGFDHLTARGGTSISFGWRHNLTDYVALGLKVGSEMEDYLFTDGYYGVRTSGRAETDFYSVGLKFTLLSRRLSPYLTLDAGLANRTVGDSGKSGTRLTRGGLMRSLGAGIEWRLEHHLVLTFEAHLLSYSTNQNLNSSVSRYAFSRPEWIVGVGETF